MADGDAAKRRVLLVGAGRRIQNNFLPVLACLADAFEVRGIHSRTPAALARVADHWRVPAIGGLAETDLARFDVAVVSVPTPQNGNVLKQLQANAADLDLVIDTPIAWTMREYAETAPLLKTFRSVTVAEDYMNFPRFSLIRQVVKSGVIGELRSITLHNIGFLYHGLALIRSFVGFDPVLSAWSKPLGGHACVVGYAFAGGFSAAVVGPYRRHTSGGIFVEGSKAIITECPIDKDFAAGGNPVYVLSKIVTDGALSGFEIRGEDRVFSRPVDDLRRMRGMAFADKSDINLERGCGLIDVFRSLLDFGNFNRDYGAANAFHDSFVSRRAESGETPLDPFGAAGILDEASFVDKAGLPRMAGSVRPGKTQVWVAKSATFVKASGRLAASLAPDQKIEASPGSRIAADLATPSQDHIILSGVTLNGAPVPGGPWFIYAPAWDPPRA
jgi:hypothetical protein